MLSFELVETDGGEYNVIYTCRNVLVNDTSVYCSNRKNNVNMILRSTHPNLFVLTHVIVKAPVSGFTSPVRDALFFVCDEAPKLSDFKQYDNFTLEKYQEFVKKRKTKGKGLLSDDPVAYVRLERHDNNHHHRNHNQHSTVNSNNNSNISVVKVEPPRAGRYVYVKLLTSDGSGENIDCQFIGFKGFIGQQSFPYASEI